MKKKLGVENKEVVPKSIVLRSNGFKVNGGEYVVVRVVRPFMHNGNQLEAEEEIILDKITALNAMNAGDVASFADREPTKNEELLFKKYTLKI